MSEKTSISVLVPVYNVERYLGRCLDSILNQTFGDIEVVCVDDCSPDGSAAILADYASRDSRVRVITKEKNEGLMMARKTGYENARGEYVFFCDSDDYLPENALERLYRAARDSRADITVGDLEMVTSRGLRARRRRYGAIAYSPDAYLKAILNWTTCSLCGSLFKRSLFDGHVYETFMNQSHSEDRILLTQLLVERQPSICTVDFVSYYYYVNDESLSHVRVTDRTLSLQFKALLWCHGYVDSHKPDMRRDNDGYIIRYMGYYIERGVAARKIKALSDVNARLLSYPVMRDTIGRGAANHIWLCSKIKPYQITCKAARRAIRKLQGKE